MAYLLKLAINDMRNIIRDRFFLFAFFAYPVMLILFSRVLVHVIEPRIGDYISFLAYESFSVVLMLFIVMTPFIYSFIAAFLILDERDEHLLTVLKIMPISRTSFLAYRMMFMLIFSFIVLLIFPPLSGLIPMEGFAYLEYIPVAFLFAMFTPVAALIVATFATNKVQAFALFKIGGTVFLIPIFAFFFDLGSLQYAFAPIPNFWSLKALDSVLSAEISFDIVSLIIGFAFHIALIIGLFYLFNKKH